MGHYGCQDRPWQPKSHGESDVACRADVPQHNRPSQLMLQKLAQPLFWKDHPDRLAHQLDAVSALGNLVAQRKIVRMMVGHGFEPADFLEPLLRGGHGPSEGEINSS